MSKDIIETQNAPAAVGPYSQAVKAQGLLYISGQLPLEPATGVMVENDMQTQTRRVLDNLQQILEAAGSSLEQTLKVTIFLTDMQQFSVVNDIYATYFSSNPPARACVEVSALPKGALVEMEAVALC
jgi:2-iminobutanoate/2-iminopropanoate deaminase